MKCPAHSATLCYTIAILPDFSLEAEAPNLRFALKEQGMCRSIKQLRNAEQLATADEIQAAALQYVRKISGYRSPSRTKQAAFDAAVAEIAAATERLLAQFTPPEQSR
jgi:hypothetical protein